MKASRIGAMLKGKGRLLSASLAAGIIAAVVLWLAVESEFGQRRVAGWRVTLDGPAQYTGSEACKECHEEVYNGWRTTFHAYKFREAGPDSVIGDFTAENTIAAGGVTTVMSRSEDGYFITTPGPEGEPRSYRVHYVLGSIWKQRYITRFPNGALQILPVQWNVKTLEWVDYQGLKDHKPGDSGYWSDTERTFQYQCLGCHTTNPQIRHDEAGDTFRTTWTEPGVGCESCHGPGSRHVAADISDKAATILNPAKLPDPRRAVMVCGACHTRGSAGGGKFAYPASYRPGDQLNFMFDEKPGTYPDGSSKNHHQQYNDWKNSGHESAGVTCWDCHSPHIRGKSNRFQLKLPGSLLCRSCHSVEPAGVHGLHSVNNCIGCHMPNTIKSATQGDLRSHRFIVARPELTVLEGSAGSQPNSCNLCHYHKDEDPERLVHFLDAVRKPVRCKACHYHAEQEPGEEKED